MKSLLRFAALVVLGFVCLGSAQALAVGPDPIPPFIPPDPIWCASPFCYSCKDDGWGWLKCDFAGNIANKGCSCEYPDGICQPFGTCTYTGN